jgi:hypothetical protein
MTAIYASYSQLDLHYNTKVKSLNITFKSSLDTDWLEKGKLFPESLNDAE